MLTQEFKKTFLLTHFCEYLTSAELEMLLQHSVTKNFLSGEVLLQQGKKSEGLYIIIQGKASTTTKILGDGVLKLSTLKQGDFVGELSLIDESANLICVIATTNLDCLLLSNDYFKMLTLFYPETKYKITRVIAKSSYHRLKNIYDQITDAMKKTDMVHRSFFSEMVKSLTSFSTTSFSEANINVQSLIKTDFFKKFTEEEINYLLLQSTVIKTTGRCTLIKENETDSSCYIVICGAVQASIIHDNKVAKLLVIGPMLPFTSFSILDVPPIGMINFTTYEHAIILKIDEANIKNMQHNFLSLWYKLFDLICKSFVLLENAANKLEVRLNSELYNRRDDNV